jgi:hypothetical protein
LPVRGDESVGRRGAEIVPRPDVDGGVGRGDAVPPMLPRLRCAIATDVATADNVAAIATMRPSWII